MYCITPIYLPMLISGTLSKLHSNSLVPRPSSLIIVIHMTSELACVLWVQRSYKTYYAYMITHSGRETEDEANTVTTFTSLGHHHSRVGPHSV